METQFVQFREQQKEMWNRFSPGWKKWDVLTMEFLMPIGNEIIRLLKPGGVDMVLDVASGTGEPGLTIASRLNGGIVVITDLAERMLEIARENAARRQITNLKIVTSDVSALPFDDNSFDAISCRLGFMFFPDMALAAKEMVRVLKPGGRIATAVWSLPEKNFWASAILKSINKYIILPPPQPGAPGLFRCAKEGLIADLFRDAGLKNISEREVSGKQKYGTKELYWDYMTEVVAPVVAALGKADEKVKAKVRSEVFDSINEKYRDGKLAFDSNARVIYGEK
jgi:ubiquinone/menaquinone biosynthesis C-methylase UbiE